MDLNSPTVARRLALAFLAVGVLALGGFLAMNAAAGRAERHAADAQFAAAHPGAAGTLVTLDVGGMSCAGCAKSVGDQLGKVPGVTACRVDLERHVAQVRLANAGVAPQTLVAAVEAAGYDARFDRAR
jgi:Cu+-exporting ATPase